MADRDDEQELAYLTEDYPNWVIQYLPEISPPWVARRSAIRLPATGGYMWISASDPRDLGHLIDAAVAHEDRLAAGPAKRARLGALRMRAAGAGWHAELDWNVLRLIAPGTTETLSVTCQPRPDDGDKLWFYSEDLPIVEADNVPDALVVLGGRAVTRGD